MNILQEIIRYGLEKIGWYYGTYRGVVQDNVDELGIGRLLVSVPELHGISSEGIIAYSKGTWSGNGYGVSVIPKKGELIWVTFVMGNPRYPIWEFGHHTAKDPVPEEFKDNNVYGLKTPNGNKVWIDDNTEEISMETKSGYFVKVRGDKVFIGNNEEEMQPMVLGNDLKSVLENILDGLMELKVSTANGPSSIPINIDTFIQIKSDLDNILSDVSSID
jgi:hypothetical protein